VKRIQRRLRCMRRFKRELRSWTHPLGKQLRDAIKPTREEREPVRARKRSTNSSPKLK